MLCVDELGELFFIISFSNKYIISVLAHKTQQLSVLGLWRDCYNVTLQGCSNQWDRRLGQLTQLSVAPLTAFDEPEELNFFYSTHLDLIHKTVCHIYSWHFFEVHNEKNKFLFSFFPLTPGPHTLPYKMALKDRWKLWYCWLHPLLLS